ncbi:MAG: hypothetical protein CBB95_17860 [Alteromonas sp. TMED35]|uniref:hypothetical protein n=1 Tax=uncultured Alteromonas sp. TaxID=179113 RepID=UPI000B656B90|nr:MAG: hypothetical protein CBB95_17860 [Alteromonas sp. TMED35]|tara:strand:+ start:61067 stop:61291 length:225 start_codon:yes stop_codon:yes gene_type:complete
MLNGVTLLPFVLLYTTDAFNVPEALTLYAESSEKAEEAFELAFPDARVVWVVQTTSVNDAYDTYHEESTFEETV